MMKQTFFKPSDDLVKQLDSFIQRKGTRKDLRDGLARKMFETGLRMKMPSTMIPSSEWKTNANSSLLTIYIMLVRRVAL